MSLPLRDDRGGPPDCEDRGGAQNGHAAEDPRGEAGAAAAASQAGRRSAARRRRLGLLAVDLAASAAVVGVLYFVEISSLTWLVICSALFFTMVLWRVYHLAQTRDNGAQLPYTCGYLQVDGKELFLVATLHISPRAPRDVKAVIETMLPDIVMIELDEERLNDMRETDTMPRQSDLQPVRIAIGDAAPTTVLAQRAIWNGEYAGCTISGRPVFNADDPYGALGDPSQASAGRPLVVSRGGLRGQNASFVWKGHMAARANASAVLVVNNRTEFPMMPRIGMDSLWNSLKMAWKSGSWGFPQVPLLMLPKEAGDSLVQQCRGGDVDVQVDFEVLPDDFPRSSLRRRLCHTVALVFSGVWILYGIIECCAVDAGEEFIQAEAAARAVNVPCVCIDVDINRLCSRLGSALALTPCNVARAIGAWIAAPRLIVAMLFPPPSNIDVLGGAVLHMLSFRMRTWIAMLFAGLAAGAFVGLLLMAFGTGAAGAASGSGMVCTVDRTTCEAFVMMAIEMYAFPQLYEAVAASRDEAMYQGIVAKAMEHRSRRLLVVVGAAHANGILQRVRDRGLTTASSPSP